MTVVNGSDLRAIQSEYENIWKEVFKGTNAAYQKITYEKTLGGESLKYGALSNLPVIKRWTGPTVKETLRFNQLETRAVPYEATFQIGIETYNGGRGEAFADQIKSNVEDFKNGGRGTDKLMFDTMINGQTELAEDGQFHFDTDHPGPNGGTQVNLSTATVSEASIRAGILAMPQFLDRDSGLPLGAKATHIIHGSKVAHIVKEVVSAPLLTGTAGTNVVAGTVTAEEWPQFGTSGKVVLVDAASSTNRPLVLGVQQDWSLQVYQPQGMPFIVFEATAVLAAGRGHWSRSYMITNGE